MLSRLPLAPLKLPLRLLPDRLHAEVFARLFNHLMRGQSLARRRVKVLALIWDNASWHISQLVRTWIRAHNQQAKRTGRGVRILVCYLPSKSPWLNPIEPKWMHGKRAIVEPARLLPALELADRVCARFDCVH